jgi:predicted regulator of Ras-like GTPase activity (Roadblock/LC7/MglB family)
VTSPLSTKAQDFNWLLVNFVKDTDGVTDAVAVSSDGLLMAMSDGLGRDDADQLAAIVAGIVSLANGVSGRFGLDTLRLIMIEMRRGLLLVSAVSDGSCMGVLATETCDVGLVGYEIAVLAERAGRLLTPALVAELKNGVSR